MGTRIEPCSTPQDSLAGNKDKLPNLTEKLIFVKYDLNQIRTVPWMPTKCSSRDKIILWSTVSKAEINSNRISITESPELVANKVSLRTRNKADCAMQRLKTRLERFKNMICTKERLKLNKHSFLQCFSNEQKIWDWSKMIKMICFKWRLFKKRCHSSFFKAIRYSPWN